MVNASIEYLDRDEALRAANRNQSSSQALSDLEAQILVLIAAGKEAADIAANVGADQASVKEHIKSILRKAISSGRPVGRPKAMDRCSSDLPIPKMLSPFTAL